MNAITTWVTSFPGFLKEVYEELSKVNWLGRKEVVQSTIAVTFVVILVAIYVSVVDFGLGVVLKAFLGGR